MDGIGAFTSGWRSFTQAVRISHATLAFQLGDDTDHTRHHHWCKKPFSGFQLVDNADGGIRVPLG